MKTKQKNASTAIIVILYVLAALFLIYGIYMVYYSMSYIKTYDSGAAVSGVNILQYVVSSSGMYLGFGIVLFAAAYLLNVCNRIGVPAMASAAAMIPESEDIVAAEEKTSEPAAIAAEAQNPTAFEAEQEAPAELQTDLSATSELPADEFDFLADHADLPAAIPSESVEPDQEMAESEEPMAPEEALPVDPAAEVIPDQTETVPLEAEAAPAEEWEPAADFYATEPYDQTSPEELPSEAVPAAPEPEMVQAVPQPASTAVEPVIEASPGPVTAPVMEDRTAVRYATVTIPEPVSSPASYTASAAFVPDHASAPDQEPAAPAEEPTLSLSDLFTEAEFMKTEAAVPLTQEPAPAPQQNLSDTLRLNKIDRKHSSGMTIRDIMEDNDF